MATSASFTDSLLSPLDRARTALFVRATRVAVLRLLLLQKQRRVPALLMAHAGVALLLAVVAPTLLLIVGPLVLGVPHVLSDLRYLVLRSALSRSLRWLLLGGCAALFGVRLLELLGWRGLARVELGVAGVLALTVVVVGAAQLRSWRTCGALLAVVALGGAGLLWPSSARLFLSHAHNVVALVIWAVLFSRSRGRALVVSLSILGVAALLLVTPLAWWGFRHGLPAAFGLQAFAAADALAPGVANTTLALGIVASFAFLQSVHYAVWLHAVPQETTRGEATLTFRMSWRGLVADFGKPALLIVTLLVVAVPLAGLLSPLRVQAAYLSLSAFHAYLELAALALLWVRADSSRTCS
jgi:hypothetical protein